MNEEVIAAPAAEPEVPAARRRRGAVGVTAVSAVLVALTIWARHGMQPDGATLALDIAVGVLGCALAPLLMWRPVTGALGLAVLAALSPAATPPATLAVLQVAQRRRLPVAVATAAAGVAAHAVQGLWQPNSGLSYGWWLVVITAGYGAMVGWGALVRANRALVMSLRERARRAEAEQGRRVAEARMAERTRIAREMHDVLAHRLSLLATYAGALEYRPDSPPERLAQAAGVVRTGVHQALEELREVILVLRDEDAAEEAARVAGRSPTLGDVPALVEESRAAGMRVQVRDEAADAENLPAAVGRTAYRVVQEGLTNARKHAPGRPVEVEVSGRPGEGLAVTVTNPVGEAGGTGRAAGAADAGGVPDERLSGGDGGSTPAEPQAAGSAAAYGSGTGLVGLTERVHLAGGVLDQGLHGDRFRLHARLPWPA
ncbi:sensor histidine kinase [Streptomonospora wellingtoniae]|uniref:histidine kinase n=1 Tax=Streptomonospora wellingtoniae TaxID=3075544 RepID=A0ABU2KNA4_9ACTN|nr:histidine kinase [Streptomonospora sp. DSM 45055]MDT0300723.1 histidine kinase [Streptomonospora sp. DSM 45055]